jgi:outer membrane lipoprotein-sorting protein
MNITNIVKSNMTRKLSMVLLFFVALVSVKAQEGPGGGGPPPGLFGTTATTTPKPSDITQYTAKNFLDLVHQTDIRASFYNSDMTATISMVMVSPDRGTVTRKQIIYRRDKDNAFLMLTLEPQSRKGQGLLLVDQNMWRYDPTSRKFTHTDLKETYENSTVRNSDFRRFQRAMDYSVSSVTSGTLGKYNVWIAELKANNNEVPFPYIKIWVEKDRQIVLKQEEYSLSKVLLRTAYYTSYVQIGDSYVPTVQIFQDGLIPEKRSQMTYTNISTKAIPDDVFTKNYLERMSQ